MSGIARETCAEGGQDVTDVESGDWSAYSNINLNGANAFVAKGGQRHRGRNIEIHLDSPAGTIIGSCGLPGTDGGAKLCGRLRRNRSHEQVHTVYLVYTGGSGSLFNLQFFGFFSTPPAPSHQLTPGNTYSLKALVDGKYVSAANGGTNALIAQSASVGATEQFQVVDAGGGNIALLASVNNLYVSADNDGASPLIANRTTVGSWETFTEFDAGGGNIALRAMNNGNFVDAANGGANPLIADSIFIGTAESFTPGFVSGLPPASPNGLTATPANGQVTLTWVSSPGASSYNVKQAASSGGPYTVIASNLMVPNYTDSSLTNGTTYYYVVSALNLSGESANSSQVIGTPGSLDRILWIASSSTSGSDVPYNAIDGDLTTRWSTGAPQSNGQWFQVDMGTANTFNKMVLNSANSPGDYPRAYQVNTSPDGVNWGNPIATNTGSSSITTITFTPQVARYIRVTQIGSASGNFWSIHEFNIFWNDPDNSNRDHRRAFFQQSGQSVVGCQRQCRRLQRETGSRKRRKLHHDSRESEWAQLFRSGCDRWNDLLLCGDCDKFLWRKRKLA